MLIMPNGSSQAGDFAQSTMVAFDLDAEAWYVIGWGAAPMGRQFDKIVAIRGDYHGSQTCKENAAAWFEESVRRRLAPDGKLYII